jgi:hypothetical protein
LDFSNILSGGFTGSEHLLTNETRENLLAWSSNLPVDFSYFLHGCEFSVDDDSDYLDYFISLSKLGSSSREIVKSIAENNEFLGSIDRNNLIKSFLDYWLSGKHHELENIWLEFDRKNQETTLSTPSLFFGYRGIRKNQANFIVTISGHFNKIINTGKVEKILSCVDSHNMQFSHFGIMLSRETEAIRLFLTGAEKSDLISFFSEMGANVDQDEFQRIFDQLKLYFDEIAIQIDLLGDGRIGNKIGLETFLLEKGKFHLARQLELIEAFLKDDLGCKKVDQLNSWVDHDLPYPETIIAGNKLVGLKRGIHHFKFDFIDNGITKSKAYLWLEGEWSGK